MIILVKGLLQLTFTGRGLGLNWVRSNGALSVAHKDLASSMTIRGSALFTHWWRRWFPGPLVTLFGLISKVWFCHLAVHDLVHVLLIDLAFLIEYAKISIGAASSHLDLILYVFFLGHRKACILFKWEDVREGEVDIGYELLEHGGVRARRELWGWSGLWIELLLHILAGGRWEDL